MSSKVGWVTSGVALWVAAVCIAVAPCALAQRAVMEDGHPAVVCDAKVSIMVSKFPAKFQDGSASWSIGLVDLNGKPALKAPVYLRSFSPSGDVGTLYLTADRVVFQAQKPKDSFDENRADVKWKMHYTLNVQTSNRKHDFYVPSQGWSPDLFPACRDLMNTAYASFPAAEAQFNGLTAHLPPMLAAAFSAFQPVAAAWRALPTKPPLGPEADREWILAENALEEKNTDSAIAHYGAALAIQQTWPTGWFNLAVIYGEQNKYADAAWCMKHYLELAPDAPDARSAREQIIIWEDKASHS
ncbi:MAG: hypothetical protein ACLP6G_07250 [Terriglobales bacterium]